MGYKVTLQLATGNTDLLEPISKFLFHHRSLLVCHSREGGNPCFIRL